MTNTNDKDHPAHILPGKDGEASTDRPWIFRTYAGHTNVRASNELYRANLAKGVTGLSIAFDLATQCGYSSDSDIARPEVGKVGVPINSLDDFQILFDEIPIEKINTSMTINGTAMWLLSLYIALAEERGIDVAELRGTTQNDLIKEFLARGTYVFPPKDSIKLVVDMYEHCLEHLPNFNPSNICSYHLQEAGATPEQELAYSLATAITVLDAIKERGCFEQEDFERCVGRISFFVNAGMRFVEEMCKMRAFVELWDEICIERYGVQNPKYRRFRYGVQVNSLGLTEEQPENNAWRILIESLGVTLSRKARCRALQLPAWNEALSLPRPWDQQWSLRIQQILAYETDLLEYPDLFDGSKVVESKVAELKAAARSEIDAVLEMGGGVEAVQSGYIKARLVTSQAQRMARISTGDQIVVGKNRWQDGIESPLVGGDDGGIFAVDREAAARTIEALKTTRATRDEARAQAALARLREEADSGNANLMKASIECAHARVTTGEWSDTLRAVFGEYRAPTGVDGQTIQINSEKATVVRERSAKFAEAHGRRPKFVVGKPGLDGHSNGAEMLAVAARDAGFDVIYSGIRLSASEIVTSAVEEDADLIGISLLSGSHMEIVEQVFEELKKHNASDIPVVLGGIIPTPDFESLFSMGVQKIFTPKDHDLMEVMNSNLDVIEASKAG